MSISQPVENFPGDTAQLDCVLARLSAPPGAREAARRSDSYRKAVHLVGQAYSAPPEAREGILEAAKLHVVPLFAAYETARLLIEEAEMDLLYADMDLTVPPDSGPDPES